MSGLSSNDHLSAASRYNFRGVLIETNGWNLKLLERGVAFKTGHVILLPRSISRQREQHVISIAYCSWFRNPAITIGGMYKTHCKCWEKTTKLIWLYNCISEASIRVLKMARSWSWRPMMKHSSRRKRHCWSNADSMCLRCVKLGSSGVDEQISLSCNNFKFS